MSELSFLIELLLNHELTKETKDIIAQRIKDVEVQISSKTSYNPRANPTQQAASTLALLAKQGDLPAFEMPPSESAVPVEQIAQTAATAQAMITREMAMHGRKHHDPATGRPRKW